MPSCFALFSENENSFLNLFCNYCTPWDPNPLRHSLTSAKHKSWIWKFPTAFIHRANLSFCAPPISPLYRCLIIYLSSLHLSCTEFDVINFRNLRNHIHINILGKDKFASFFVNGYVRLRNWKQYLSWLISNCKENKSW